MSTYRKGPGPDNLVEECLQFCDYVVGICDENGRLRRIEEYMETNNASFLTKNVLKYHKQNYESFENLLNQFEKDVKDGIARIDKNIGDPDDVGGDEWDCKKIVNLIVRIKGDMSKKKGQRRKITSNQISKDAAEVRRGVLAVIKGLLAKVYSFKRCDRRFG